MKQLIHLNQWILTANTPRRFDQQSANEIGVVSWLESGVFWLHF
ncbi:hypothetical protein [Paraglaciecola sp.]